MQKRSQKSQSLQDKKKQCRKDVGTCDGEVKTKLHRERLGSKNWRKSLRGFAWQKRSWMKKSECCKEKDEAVVHLSPMGALIRPWWSSSSRWEQHKHGSTSMAAHLSSSRGV